MAPFAAVLNYEIIKNKSDNWADRPTLTALTCIQTHGSLMEMNDGMIQFQVSLLQGREDNFKCNCLILSICLGFKNFM